MLTLKRLSETDEQDGVMNDCSKGIEGGGTEEEEEGDDIGSDWDFLSKPNINVS